MVRTFASLTNNKEMGSPASRCVWKAHRLSAMVHEDTGQASSITSAAEEDDA